MKHLVNTSTPYEDNVGPSLLRGGDWDYSEIEKKARDLAMRDNDDQEDDETEIKPPKTTRTKKNTDEIDYIKDITNCQPRILRNTKHPLGVDYDDDTDEDEYRVTTFAPRNRRLAQQPPVFIPVDSDRLTHQYMINEMERDGVGQGNDIPHGPKIPHRQQETFLSEKVDSYLYGIANEPVKQRQKVVLFGNGISEAPNPSSEYPSGMNEDILKHEPRNAKSVEAKFKTHPEYTNLYKAKADFTDLNNTKNEPTLRSAIESKTKFIQTPEPSDVVGYEQQYKSTPINITPRKNVETVPHVGPPASIHGRSYQQEIRLSDAFIQREQVFGEKLNTLQIEQDRRDGFRNPGVIGQKRPDYKKPDNIWSSTETAYTEPYVNNAYRETLHHQKITDGYGFDQRIESENRRNQTQITHVRDINPTHTTFIEDEYRISEPSPLGVVRVQKQHHLLPETRYDPEGHFNGNIHPHSHLKINHYGERNFKPIPQQQMETKNIPYTDIHVEELIPPRTKPVPSGNYIGEDYFGWEIKNATTSTYQYTTKPSPIPSRFKRSRRKYIHRKINSPVFTDRH